MDMGWKGTETKDQCVIFKYVGYRWAEGKAENWLKLIKYLRNWKVIRFGGCRTVSSKEPLIN